MLIQGDTKQEKWEYFKEYYLRLFIFGGGLLIAGICFLYTSFWGYRTTAIDIMFVENGELELGHMKACLENVLDTEGEEIVVEQLSEEAALSQTILPIRIAAGDIDLLLTDRRMFQEYARNGIMEDLLEVLPDEIYEKAKDRLVLERARDADVQGTVREIEEERPYGISLRNMDRMKTLGITIADPVVGIVKGTDDLEMEIETIRYFIK